MGDPKKQKKKYRKPLMVWNEERIARDKELIKNFGLKMLEKFAEKMVGIQVRYPKLVILAILLISFMLMPGILKIQVEPSLEKVLPQAIPVIETMNDMRIQFGADMVYIVIDSDYISDMRDPKIIKYLDVLQNKLITSENILEVTSLATVVKENKGFIPDSMQEIKNILVSIKNY